MKRTINVAASFLVGATAMVLLDRAVARRRAGGLVGSQERLRARVKARIAELASHPEAINVQIEGGLVRVSGHVLAAEMDRLLSELTHVSGVHRVHNALSAVSDPSRFERLREGATAELATDDLRS